MEEFESESKSDPKSKVMSVMRKETRGHDRRSPLRSRLFAKLYDPIIGSSFPSEACIRYESDVPRLAAWSSKGQALRPGQRQLD